MAIKSGGGQRGAHSEITGTPLVDVMLVLLIVFMVTTPIIVDELKPRKVEVELPHTSANTPLRPTDLQQLILDVRVDLRVTLTADADLPPDVLADCSAMGLATVDFTPCLAELETKLRNNPKVQQEKKVFLQADRRLPYGFVVDVMARIRNAGVTQLGMVTNPPEAGEADAAVPLAPPTTP